jgi:hypothetical protein
MPGLFDRTQVRPNGVSTVLVPIVEDVILVKGSCTGMDKSIMVSWEDFRETGV